MSIFHKDLNTSSFIGYSSNWSVTSQETVFLLKINNIKEFETTILNDSSIEDDHNDDVIIIITTYKATTRIGLNMLGMIKSDWLMSRSECYWKIITYGVTIVFVTKLFCYT